MRLSMLHEYVDLAKSSHDFYGDPKSKAKPLSKKKNDLSFLKYGTDDRDRFIKKINKGGKKK